MTTLLLFDVLFGGIKGKIFFELKSWVFVRLKFFLSKFSSAIACAAAKGLAFAGDFWPLNEVVY
jgi:hypothetical protein